MALEKLFGLFSSPSSEEENKNKELCPLAEGEVATYGSHDNSERSVDTRDYVVISCSDEDISQHSRELVDRDGLPEHPPSANRGILKTTHSSKPPSLSPPRKGHTIEWRSRADMPVRMKGLQAALHRGHVYVGGGYTGHIQTEMTVYDYDPNFDLWAELPVAPMRWFGMAEFKGQLVLVGGKDIEGRGMKMTNRIAAYNDEESKWEHPFPPMSAARSQPLVFSHTHLLVVAGGRKGVLDYHVEVFNGTRWTQASPLPVPCSPISSHLHNGRWYLLGGVSSSTIHHLALDEYLAALLMDGAIVTPQGHADTAGTSWKKLVSPSFIASRVASVGRHMTVFSSPQDGPGTVGGSQGTSVHVHQLPSEEDGWIHVGKLPSVCGTACHICLHRGELYLFGGDVDGIHYSNKVYRVTTGSTGPQRKQAKFAS